MSRRTATAVAAVLAGACLTASLGLSTAQAAPDLDAATQRADDIVLVPGAPDPIAATRRDARTADRRRAPVVRDVYVSVVQATDTTADDANALEDLSRAKVEAAIEQVSDFWAEESGGRVAFDVVAYETGRQLHMDPCNRFAALDAAKAAAFDGIALDPAWAAQGNVFLALSREPFSVCGGAVAHLGGPGVFVSEGVEDVGEDDTTAGLTAMLHEFGHTIGFAHADAGICRSATAFDAPITTWDDATLEPDSRCPYVEYGDYQDIMGFSVIGARPHLSALRRWQAGWLEGSTLTPALGTTTTVLRPLDDPSGIRAIPVTDPRTGALYVVEYRTNAGEDATSYEFTWPGRDDDLAFFYLYDPLPGEDASFARWQFDTPYETGGVRILRVLYAPDDVGRYDPMFPSFRETLALAVGTSTFNPDVYNRNLHLDAGESFTSYSGGFVIDALDLDAGTGAEVRVRLSKAPSTTALTVVDKSLRVGQKPQLRIRVAAPTASTVTGKVVVVVDGRPGATVTLPAKGTGVAVVTLPAFKKVGKHTIALSYGGSARALPSKARAVAVSVTR